MTEASTPHQTGAVIPPAALTAGDLSEQVACVAEFNPALLDRVRREVTTVPGEWQEEYGEAQSGGWFTLSLYNSTGSAQDVTIADCDPVETGLLAQMPVTRSLLRDLGLRYMWVRMARLSAGSYLWEHRDYAELSDSERYRLHIPLETNPSAYLVVGGTKVHMGVGRMWRLTPTYPHGVCNIHGPDRVHLIIDCYADQGLTSLLSSASLPADATVALPTLTEAERAARLSAAHAVAGLGYHDEAESILLRTFFERYGPEGASYEMVADLHARLADPISEAKWRSRKAAMLAQASQAAAA